MKKVIFIVFMCFVLSTIEFIIYNLVGRWFLPDFLFLFVIFINLFLGIRFSLVTAFAAGIMKDSLSTAFFGINVFSYVLSVFLMTLLKRYIYRRGSRALRLFLVLVMVTINFLILWMLNFMFFQANLVQAFEYVLMPQLMATLVVALQTFDCFKQCASKLSVSS
jgi:rod shape-determining protein MreD